MVDFNNLLKKRAVDAEKPKTLPAGNYNAVVLSHDTGESQQKKTPYLRFNYRLLSAHSEVDEEALAAIPNWNERKLYQDFYLTPDALYRLREHIEKMGIEVGDRMFDELIPETLQKQVVLVVGQEPSKKPGDDSIYNRVLDVIKSDA